ncbi:hypothetical protein ACFWN7_00515 [Agromyces sp. NPDC058484]|uniref:hypothetical protein n=1 Tax=Agromyces sp. NPDC058484 TaxID=3346524 RepID=UPI0036509A1D
MSFFLWLWFEEIAVCTVALVALGILLHAARVSTVTVRGESFIGRVSALLALAGIVLLWWSRWWATPDENVWRYALPILAAVFAIAIHATFSARATGERQFDAVDLALRSIWSYGSRWWFVGWWTLAALITATVVLAGLASSTDERGRYTMMVIQLGTSRAGTTFFGWSFGLPVLVALAVLVAVVLMALRRVSIPAVPADPIHRERDRAHRRGRTRTILSIACGAVSFTLGASWLFIGQSSRLAASMSTPEGMRVDVGTSFAALAMPLAVGGILLEGLGLALIAFALFQPRARAADRSRVPSAARAESVAN